ncbi:hypothetical protein HK102_007105 [Quaeritorhiza haematococci]|nr:hypothetical protein HK102_007105 [Quaeritorhiza haematococci]
MGLEPNPPHPALLVSGAQNSATSTPIRRQTAESLALNPLPSFDAHNVAGSGAAPAGAFTTSTLDEISPSSSPTASSGITAVQGTVRPSGPFSFFRKNFTSFDNSRNNADTTANNSIVTNIDLLNKSKQGEKQGIKSLSAVPLEVSDVSKGTDTSFDVRKSNGKLSRTKPKAAGLPFCVLTNDRFYSSEFFEPRRFNAWFRRNSFSRPYHVLFLLKWFVWLLLVLTFFLFPVRFFPLPTRTILYALFGTLTALELCFAIRTMSIDPMDEAVVKANAPRNVEYVKVAGVPVIDEDSGMCGICQVKVDAGTKHCKPCNKCVGEFDHHCAYLNTCIGYHNYLEFFTTMFFASLGAIGLTVVTFYTFAMYWSHQTEFADTVEILFGSRSQASQKGATAGLFLYGFLCLLTAGAVSHLFGFHIRLWYLDMTTLEYLEMRTYGPATVDPNPWRNTTNSSSPSSEDAQPDSTTTQRRARRRRLPRPPLRRHQRCEGCRDQRDVSARLEQGFGENKTNDGGAGHANPKAPTVVVGGVPSAASR